jgi:hypothetical protein
LQQDLSHRVRLTGGFYGYQSETRETAARRALPGKSDAKGQFSCEVRSEQGGEIRSSA